MTQDQPGVEEFLQAHPHTRSEIASRPCPVPPLAGAYGWWFNTIPGPIDASRCHQRDGLVLLYVGISPTRPFTNGKAASRQHLQKRIKYHYGGNAEGSTLRKTLGVLLAKDLNIELRRVGSGTRRTFTNAGEAVLHKWMEEHARVSWVPHTEPWLLEEELFTVLDLPLNLQGNSHNSFYPTLKRLRAEAEKNARDKPII